MTRDDILLLRSGIWSECSIMCMFAAKLVAMNNLSYAGAPFCAKASGKVDHREGRRVRRLCDRSRTLKVRPFVSFGGLAPFGHWQGISRLHACCTERATVGVHTSMEAFDPHTLPRHLLLPEMGLLAPRPSTGLNCSCRSIQWLWVRARLPLGDGILSQRALQLEFWAPCCSVRWMEGLNSMSSCTVPLTGAMAAYHGGPRQGNRYSPKVSLAWVSIHQGAGSSDSW